MRREEEPSVLEEQALAIIRTGFPELAKAYESGPDSESGTGSLRGCGAAANFSQDGEPASPECPRSSACCRSCR
jgi:hypothetical protein